MVVCIEGALWRRLVIKRVADLVFYHAEEDEVVQRLSLVVPELEERFRFV